MIGEPTFSGLSARTISALPVTLASVGLVAFITCLKGDPETSIAELSLNSDGLKNTTTLTKPIELPLGLIINSTGRSWLVVSKSWLGWK